MRVERGVTLDNCSHFEIEWFLIAVTVAFHVLCVIMCYSDTVMIYTSKILFVL